MDMNLNIIKYIGIDMAGKIQREEISQDEIKQITNTISSLTEKLEENNLSMPNNATNNDIKLQKEIYNEYREEIIKCIFEYGPDDVGKAFDLSVACGNEFQKYVDEGKELPQPIDLFNDVLYKYIA